MSEAVPDARGRAGVAARGVGLAAIGLLLAYWFLQPIPLTFKTVVGVLCAASIAWPQFGLLAFAALAPLSTPAANLFGGPGLGGQMLEQLALAVGVGALTRPGAGARTRLGGPALGVGVVALASAASLVPAAAAPLARHVFDAAVFEQLSLRATAQSTPAWSPLFAGLLIAEWALLAWAVERLVRQWPGLAVRLVALALVGHAAAALLDVQAVVAAAMRTGEALSRLPGLLAGMRVSVQTDWNAAASSLVLAGGAGLGLLQIVDARWRRLVWLLLALVVAGLWITGSRIALAMGTAAAVVAALSSAAAAGRGRRGLAVSVGALALAAGAALLVFGTAVRSDAVPRSIALRAEMARAGIAMFQSAPVFGIGVGKFYESSEPLAGPYLRSVGWRPRENAHNNFIQVLAEQGVAGLTALVWFLAATVLAGIRAQVNEPTALRGGLLLGIGAALGTWLTGHPLLVPEFALVFGFYTGMLAARTPSPAGRPWLPLLLAAIVAATVPVRASALRDAADLEHYGLDLSLWQHDDSQRYREAGAAFALFIPATGRPVEVPMRRAPGAPDRLMVGIRAGSRLIDDVVVEGDDWKTVLVVLPAGPRRYELVDFAILTSAGGDVPEVLLRVGKMTAR